MTARTLDLREACLQAPTAYDVAIVGSMMLFPADEELRRRTLGAVDIDLRLQSTNLQLTPAEMRQFIELIRIMPRPADYEEQIKDAYASGIIVGRMLLQVLAGSTLTAIKKDIASGYRTSVSTINSRWHDYQCVAAYWAAYIRMGGPWTDHKIPCRPGDLGPFLLLADRFRRRAETTHIPHSPRTLLRAGDTVMIPSSSKLPRWHASLGPAAFASATLPKPRA